MPCAYSALEASSGPGKATKYRIEASLPLTRASDQGPEERVRVVISVKWDARLSIFSLDTVEQYR